MVRSKLSDDSKFTSPVFSEEYSYLDSAALAEMTLDDIFRSDKFGLLNLPKPRERTDPESRLKSSFLEICDFFEKRGRLPDSKSPDMTEAKLASRLQGLKLNPDKVRILELDDKHGLLAEAAVEPLTLNEIFLSGNADLLADNTGLLDTSSLPPEAKRTATAGEVARREKCHDFPKYEGHFRLKHAELSAGIAKLIPFMGRNRINTGSTFILNGVMVFVAEVGEVEYKRTTIRENRRERMRLIFENATESAMYRQSFSLRLAESPNSYEIVPSSYEVLAGDDQATGWIYVAQSLSSDPRISSRPNLYKIGFTTTPVKQRLAGAESSPTYLMAPVQVVCEYRTYNMKSSVLEHLLHRVFSASRLDISQVGLNGRQYDSTEWFDVPLHVIDHAINALMTGEIIDLLYDPEIGALVPMGEA